MRIGVASLRTAVIPHPFALSLSKCPHFAGSAECAQAVPRRACEGPEGALVITQFDITLAQASDAHLIAELSRDAIEYGLSWRWTARRVARSIRDSSTNVVVARQSGHFLGFAIMKYEDEAGHLLLLAVQPAHRRKGAGSALWAWLESTVRVAGIARVHLETRMHNAEALSFYERLGFTNVGLHHGYYEGIEDAIRMVKDMGRAPG
jgi:ribosomal-protein-alanine N-acetyltransferase